MKRFFSLRLFSTAMLVFLALSLVFNINRVYANGSSPQSSGAQTYTVLVGAEDTAHGVGFMRFFPSQLTVHVGDTVTWKANSVEIHTVTFLNGEAIPELLLPVDKSLNAPSPLEMNQKAVAPAAPANGQYDGSTYASSGLMSSETAPGQAQTFSLTFTKEGMYMYLCVVHGMAMSGEINVVSSTVSTTSPDKVSSQARSEIKSYFTMENQAGQIANLEHQPDVRNADGTTTHYVMIGAEVGVFSMMRFFPSTVNVKPGDRIVWYLSPTNMAPHTITFMNGAQEPALVMPFPAGSTPPQHLLLNPQILFPANADAPLNGKAFTSSGLLTPGQGPQSFSLVVDKNFTGKLEYICMLHDGSGMAGWVNVSK